MPKDFTGTGMGDPRKKGRTRVNCSSLRIVTPDKLLGSVELFF